MTIKDIAKLSGCGVSTVSRALNGNDDISPQTKAKIESIIEQYNYVPNKNARQLKRENSNSILIIVKGNMNLFFASIIEKIQKELDQKKISSSISYIDELGNEVQNAISLSREIKPLGIIFLGANFNFFEKSFSKIKIPSVVTSTYSEECHFKNLSTVSINDFEAGYKAMSYLVSEGHRKIGIIRGDVSTCNPSNQRLEGCKKCLLDNGIELLPNQVEQCYFSATSAYDSTIMLLKKNPDITAIFSMSDIMAMGTIRALLDLGKKVPDDVSVLGIDGIKLASYFYPRITTMSQPANKLASLSVKVLMDMIYNNTDGSDILLPVTLKNGESVKTLIVSEQSN